MHLTVIAKAPEPGRVKTRLTPPCTPGEAASVAAAALADTLDAVDVATALAAAGRAPPVRRVVLLDGAAREWVPPGYDVVVQRGPGLGARLANGFADLGPGVIVGMDTPAAGRWLPEALTAVDAGADVLGLASDGGYWVIGLARVDRQVFDGIPMSRSDTGLAQLRRLHALGRPVRLLPMARDLDDEADLRAHARVGGSGRLALVARSIVERMGEPVEPPVVRRSR
ncbi:MAG: TIGR04282 family arsenosugar biosynthesis glycosyltransferase [Ilumatobacteraceae bacterium]